MQNSLVDLSLPRPGGAHGSVELNLAATAAALVAVWVIGRLLRRGTRGRRAFWWNQGVAVAMAVLAVGAIVAIWFDDPRRLAVPAGLLTAGIAVALQRAILAVAGYFVILGGRVFRVGDRIAMGGVRGDVIALGFTRTQIMEMGQPPTVQAQQDEPAMWIGARQYTGRVVTVTNDRVFDEPVYNYTREFPFIWEEIRVPVRYDADRARAEEILLEAARRRGAETAAEGRAALERLGHHYFIEPVEVEARVYVRLTDNWIELALRFLARDHGVRDLKDAISRDILAGLQAASIEVASATYEIVGLPPLRITEGAAPRSGA